MLSATPAMPNQQVQCSNTISGHGYTSTVGGVTKTVCGYPDTYKLTKLRSLVAPSHYARAWNVGVATQTTNVTHFTIQIEYPRGISPPIFCSPTIAQGTMAVKLGEHMCTHRRRPHLVSTHWSCPLSVFYRNRISFSIHCMCYTMC